MPEPGISISIRNSTDIAAARRSSAALGSRAGFDNDQISNLGIVVTEAAGNVLKHGGGGEIILRREDRRIEVSALDKGQGTGNTAQCFEDGYSTVGTPGTGLGAISRLSSFREMYSLPGAGTVLVIHVGGEAKYGIVNVPYPGEAVSGDAWLVTQAAGRLRIMVVDGLGHGVAAGEAANAATGCAMEHSSASASDVLHSVHRRLRNTRGAAASVADLSADRQAVDFCGIGNVIGVVALNAHERRQMVSANGTLGLEVRKVQSYSYPLESNSLVVLHSDGLSANWPLEKYPGLFARHPSTIAAVLFRDFRRERDDATVVVVRVDRESRPSA